jgi:hypothetical protein
MAIKIEKSDFRVVVRPRNPGDFGWASISGQKQSDADWISDCERIADQIRRHVDGLPSYAGRGVAIEWDQENVCEHCGSGWTEDSAAYNGGCCAEDEKNNPENVKEPA